MAKFANVGVTTDALLEQYPEPSVAEAKAIMQGDTPAAKRGRPSIGKRSNSEYVMVSGFVKKALHKRALAVVADSRYTDAEIDFSDILNIALTEYLEKHHGK